ncbi:MAG: hypothetical protein HKO66_16010 [Saprospiraceae bacterium]|nr:hypothetical protein [Bacteroidia bacterium]NNE14714.1 hypothetical protein [Saprospiraceae bacterium]NNL93748.1 hypothetical protein [Saprospiraceae bacterium]
MREQFYNFDIYDIPESNAFLEGITEKATLLVCGNKDDLDNNIDLITKILAAIDFKIGETAFLEKLTDDQGINLSKVTPHHVDHVLCFGLMPKDIGFNASFKPNHFYKTENFSLLLSYSLSDIASNNKNKKALWGALQVEFK